MEPRWEVEVGDSHPIEGEGEVSEEGIQHEDGVEEEEEGGGIMVVKVVIKSIPMVILMMSQE